MLPAERPGHAPSPDLARSREAMAQAAAAERWRCHPPGREAWLDNVRVLRFSPKSAARATVLHFHGGGFRQGCPEVIDPDASALAQRCGVEVICPAYRTAPDYPVPAGLRDSVIAWTGSEINRLCRLSVRVIPLAAALPPA